MLTLLFLVWLCAVTLKLGVFALRAGWGIMKILFTIVFLPVIVLGLLFFGLIQLAIPILVILGIVTLAKSLLGEF